MLGITVWTAVGAETVFDHWTRRIEATTKTDAVAEPASSASSPVRWELRPLYQRALMSVSILGFGTGLGVLFLSARSRIVRRLLHGSGSTRPVYQSVKPAHVYANDVNAAVDSDYIVVETVANWGSGKGKVIPKRDCELRPGRDETEMLLSVKGLGARDLWLGLDKATIEGSSVPGGTQATRQRLLEIWGQGKQTGRWKSGPIVDGGL